MGPVERMVRRHFHLPLCKPWPTVVAYCWIVRLQVNDQLDFLLVDFESAGRFGAPKNLLPDCHIVALRTGEVFGDYFIACTAEVVNRIGNVLSDVDLSIRICDLVDDLACHLRYFVALEVNTGLPALAIWTL